MKEFYGLFDSSISDRREYIEDDLAKWYKAIATNGVSDEESFKPEVMQSALAISLGYGSAILDGRVYRIDDDGGEAEACRREEAEQYKGKREP